MEIASFGTLLKSAVPSLPCCRKHPHQANINLKSSCRPQNTQIEITTEMDF